MKIPETGTECIHLDYIQGTNSSEWECPECHIIWTSPSRPKCNCINSPSGRGYDEDVKEDYMKSFFQNVTITFTVPRIVWWIIIFGVICSIYNGLHYVLHDISWLAEHLKG